MFTARDVVAHLNEVQTRSVNDFSWISQLRYYFIQDLVQVKMITTTVAYAYEYLGNTVDLSSHLSPTGATGEAFTGGDCMVIIVLNVKDQFLWYSFLKGNNV